MKDVVKLEVCNQPLTSPRKGRQRGWEWAPFPPPPLLFVLFYLFIFFSDNGSFRIVPIVSGSIPT